MDQEITAEHWIVQPHGCESQDSQFWIPADHRKVVIEAPEMISPWQTDMSEVHRDDVVVASDVP